VLHGFKKCSFILTGSQSDGSVDYSKHVEIRIDDITTRIVDHPDSNVDLALLWIPDLINKATSENGPIFYTSVSAALIPNDEQQKSLTPIEGVLTIGYPGDFWDKTNNIPIFHRAITATPPYIDFMGRKEFLIDTTEWFGSSGSPVFIYSPSGWIDFRKHIAMMGQTRLYLIGIVYGVASYAINGVADIKPAPTTLVPLKSLVPINASACISSTRILDFEPVLAEKGVKVPEGYVMRAKRD
jgi:hypothetical protein